MEDLFYIAIVVVLWGLKKLWDSARDATETPPRAHDFEAPRRRPPAGVPPLTSPERARYELEKTRARRAQAQRQRERMKRAPVRGEPLAPQLARQAPVFQTHGMADADAGGSRSHILPSPMPVASAPQAEVPPASATPPAASPPAPTLAGDLCGAPALCERETRACLTRDDARAALASPESARRIFALQEILRPPLSVRPHAFLAFPFER